MSPMNVFMAAVVLLAMVGCRSGVREEDKAKALRDLNASIGGHQRDELKACVSDRTYSLLEKSVERQSELERLEDFPGLPRGPVPGLPRGTAELIEFNMAHGNKHIPVKMAEIPNPPEPTEDELFMETLHGLGAAYRLGEGDVLERLVDGQVVQSMDARFVKKSGRTIVDFSAGVVDLIEEIERKIESRKAELKAREREAIEAGRCDDYLLEAYRDTGSDDGKERYRGFVSRVDGEMMLPMGFNGTEGFVDGLASVAVNTPQGEGMGLIDCKGTWVLEPRYSWVYHVKAADMVRVGVKTAEQRMFCFYLETGGERAWEDDYDLCQDFSEGLAAVRVDGLWGFIDTAGKLVIEPRFTDVSPEGFTDGIARVELGHGEHVTIDTAGEVVQPTDGN